MRIAGAFAIVTGGSRGIGAALIRALAERGGRGLAVSRSGRAPNVPGWTAISLDVTAPDAPERLAAAAPTCDLLVHNAGLARYGTVEQLTDADLEAVFALNVLAPMRLTRALMPQLHASPGAAVWNVASVAGRVSVAHSGLYAASKAALIAWSQSLRQELSPDGSRAIHVGTLLPGTTRTHFFEDAGYERLPPEAGHSRAVSADAVARAFVRGVEASAREVYVPATLRYAGWLNAIAPGLVERGLRAARRRADPAQRPVRSWPDAE